MGNDGTGSEVEGSREMHRRERSKRWKEGMNIKI
jgi:hypothetical protein